MRAGLPMVAVLLLAACAGAPSLPSPTDGPTPAPRETPAPEVRILASDLSSDFAPFSVAAATDQTELEALWARLSPGLDEPAVDFERELLLFLGMAGSSSCPERFERLVVDETQRVYAEWALPPANQPCTDDLAAQGLLLAVQRSALPSQPFILSLRREPVCADCAEQPDQTVVDPG